MYRDLLPALHQPCNATLVSARQSIPGLQKVRHGLFITVVCQDPSSKTDLWSRPPFSNQHKRTLLPGRCMLVGNNTAQTEITRKLTKIGITLLIFYFLVLVSICSKQLAK